MKKLTLTLLASVAVIALIFANVQIAIAADDVSNTKHRIASYSGSSTAQYGGPQICVYCHTPHNSNSTVAAPLWNRNVESSGFTMYSSPTLNMVPSGAPTGVSLACLSCHDGQIALDVIVNMPGRDGDTRATPAGLKMGSTGNPDYDPMLTRDLSDDHPISLAYPLGAATTVGDDEMFNSLPTDLSFFDDVVAGRTIQCATCHNPHEATIEKFLRKDNKNGSVLCLTCHKK